MQYKPAWLPFWPPVSQEVLPLIRALVLSKKRWAYGLETCSFLDDDNDDDFVFSLFFFFGSVSPICVVILPFLFAT